MLAYSSAHFIDAQPMFDAVIRQLTGVSIDDWKLQLQANQIFNVSSRITRAMVEIALQSMQMQTCVSVLKLEQAVETRCYPEFSTIWSQFDAIGQKHSTTLFGHVKTIQQLKTFDSFQIECLIGKATAQKLKESVAKLPMFAPQLMNVRFLDRHLVTQDCKWEVQIEIQRSYTPQECRVNVVAGLWQGAASLVKRHYLLQEFGPANAMNFTVTSKPNDRNIIIHLAVLSCTHAGIDREIIYKCAIDSGDSKKPSAGRIDEINEKTLEVLAKKKPESHESRDYLEEDQSDHQFRESQSTQAKRKPKPAVTKDRDTLGTDESFTLTERQLGLLPNKALKTATKIKTKQVQHESTDNTNRLACEQELFEQELFKQMDYPKSLEHNHKGTRGENKEELQERYEAHNVKLAIMKEQSNYRQLSNEVKHNPKQIKENFSVPSKEMSPIEICSMRSNEANRLEELRFQNEIQKPVRCGSRNLFEKFAYNPRQSDSLVSKSHRALEKKPVETALAKPCEKIAILSPRKIIFDADRSLHAASLQGIHPFSEDSHFEGRACFKVCETNCKSVNAKSMNEQTLPVTQNARMIQVTCLLHLTCCARLSCD